MKNLINIIILVCAYVNQSAAQGCIALRQVNGVSATTSSDFSANVKDDFETGFLLE